MKPQKGFRKAGMPIKDKKASVGGKMKPLFGITKKKSESDIEPAAAGRGKAARAKRLAGVRI